VKLLVLYSAKTAIKNKKTDNTFWQLLSCMYIYDIYLPQGGAKKTTRQGIVNGCGSAALG
jgi:hypothetical protein